MAGLNRPRYPQHRLLRPATCRWHRDRGHARGRWQHRGSRPGQPAPAMTTGRRSGNQDAGLERLKRRCPRWRIWRGHATGEYWAMPPRGHPTAQTLIAARDLDALARRIAQAEEQHDL